MSHLLLEINNDTNHVYILAMWTSQHHLPPFSCISKNKNMMHRCEGKTEKRCINMTRVKQTVLKRDKEM